MVSSGTLRVAIALAAVGLSCVGCTSHSNNAAPTSTTTTAEAPLWDACSLPADVARQAGLKPETKRTMVQFTGETSCNWTGDNYSLTVIADRNMTLHDVRGKYGNRGFVDVAITGRPGLQYYDNGENPPSTCDMAFTVKTGGLVALLLDNAIATATNNHPCDQLRQAATALLPALPAG